MIDTTKFIEIEHGLWYEIETGLPWSSKGNTSSGIINDYLTRIDGKDSSGYYDIKSKGKWHRLIWKYFKGGLSKKQHIDHINNIRDDNRLSNLQIKTKCDNTRKRLKQSNNTSGFPGVYWSKQLQKWVAQIYIKTKCIRLGSFDDPLVAFQEYLIAKVYYHGRDSIDPLI